MKININNGLVDVEFSKQSPERIKELLNVVKQKYGIKNNKEMAKLFGFNTDSGARTLRSWVAPADKVTHLPMPKLSYELLLQLAGEGSLEVNNG